MASPYRFSTVSPDAGLRLDQVLARHVPGLSRTRARTLLGLGGVFVDGKRTKVAGRLVREGQRITVHLGGLEGLAQLPPGELPGPLVIHFEDTELLVVDKPSGVFSAPTPESDQHDLLAHLARRGDKPLHLVHRLDRPTSGLLVVAKTPSAAALLGEQFRDHSIGRSYLALLVGPLDEDTISVTLPVEERPARTDFTLLERSAKASFVRAELFTGRTHQVRRHAESLGHPIAGDSKYGRFLQRQLPRRAPRLALHAERLRFMHPDGRQLEFESPWPEDLEGYRRELFEP